jgi:hypothetical protein
MDAVTAAHRARRAAGRRHPVEDFLYDYYGLRPGRVRRWHPGAGVVLAGDGATGRAGWRWYVGDDAGARLDVAAFLADRADTVRAVHRMLTAVAAHAPALGCFGLHEWAMVYRATDDQRRHRLPLRLGPEGTDQVVEALTLRCSHIDAFRFFTPQARVRNTLHPTRAAQAELDQPGCLHVTMDCVKWALRLGPAVPGELLADCVELARDARVTDMEASPYDVSGLGYGVVAIETAEGRAEYVRRQRTLADRAAGLRRQLIDVCAGLLGR